MKQHIESEEKLLSDTQHDIIVGVVAFGLGLGLTAAAVIFINTVVLKD